MSGKEGGLYALKQQCMQLNPYPQGTPLYTRTLTCLNTARAANPSWGTQTGAKVRTVSIGSSPYSERRGLATATLPSVQGLPPHEATALRDSARWDSLGETQQTEYIYTRKEIHKISL